MPEATGTQLTRQSQELVIFHDVAKALTSSLDLDSILQTIMEKMAEYFRPDTWSLLMVDEPHNELYFAIAVGDAAEALKNVRLKVGEGIAGWVAKHGEQVISSDVENDPRFAKRIDEATQWETHSVICVPLKSRLRVLGVIQLVNVDMPQFNEPEVFFLQALCDYAAIAIENVRLLASTGEHVSLAQLTKVSTDDGAEEIYREGEQRYSPAEVVDAVPEIVYGNPVRSKICTSHIERQNLSIRMGMKRMARLTLAFSKKWENLQAAYSLWFAFYNFCRIHKTLRVTPAMEAGIFSRPLSVAELLYGQ